jgi:preprotein translocase subunit Sec61beta
MASSRNASRFAINLIAGGLVMFWAALAVGIGATAPAIPTWLRMLVAVSVAAIALFALPRLAVRTASRRRLFEQPAAATSAAWWGRLIGFLVMMHWCLFHGG